MGRIRILLAELPQMLSDLLKQAAARRPDMEIVGEFTDGMSLLLAADETHADAVVLGLHDGELPGICSHLLSEYPRIKLFAVAADGGHAMLYELRPQKVPISETSPEGLLDAIRTAVRSQGS